ncbi:MAG TPA: polynucleotide adenylyltransferase PcnB [Vicinamibacterales bacterium]|nr:polynucleotide adenylyltransferase PcnB [Vicinamibacterales bacterium]
MVEPRIVPREQHPISRRDIDADALKVLYRLRQYSHTAYLVGGSVRDLLVARRPKDFDIGTSAHPYQVKKLFRNCWIIGRRFRLAHVKFGTKVIEVATFRRQVAAGEEVVADGVPAPDPSTPEGEHLIHHDNTFGSPEEDAFRRDFTINALFYDIATFSIIDYVGGLDDLHARVVRSIGDPDVRLREDPVRMLRAIALGARLDFAIDPKLLESIRRHRHEIAKSSPARMLEEYYKILRAGSAEKAFRGLADVGLLEPISTELHAGATDALWRALAALDAYRRGFESFPDTLTNAILLGTLLVPLGINLNDVRPREPDRSQTASQTANLTASQTGSQTGRNLPTRIGPKLGNLPLARRDVERLRQVLGLQRRLRDVQAAPRAQKSLAHRHIFAEALTWLDIHGGAPDLVAHWKAIAAEAGPHVAHPHGGESHGPQAATGADGDQPPRRRRRRRRRRGHFSPTT